MTPTSEEDRRRLLGELMDPAPHRRGFTLVELLVVILVLGILLALLLPAINAALRTAKNAAVGGEINQLAQALASFKAKYGDYPPSRIYLAEEGNYGLAPATAIAVGDITYAQLAQRSLAIMRKFFPRAIFNSSNVDVFPAASARWYDFNGDGVFQYHTPYILQGHECLVFFLGGIVQSDSFPIGPNSKLGMSGFAKDPTNPFVNVNVTNNRQTPFFEFVGNRLLADPANPYAGRTVGGITFTVPQIPGYLDSLGNQQPDGIANDPINFYAYFSSYGNGGYDPNDVNFPTETVQPVTNQIPELGYRVNFFIPPPPGPNPCISFAPNPYTNTPTIPATGSATFINPQSFQIISSGLDGTYGVGGQYSPDNSAESLPLDVPGVYSNNWVGTVLRFTERDNVTNFHRGKLE